jgi:hypothetical protein
MIKLRYLLSACAVALLPTLVVTAPASADPLCNGYSCEGYQAADFGCVPNSYPIAGAELQSTDPNDTSVRRVDLYYSPDCDAAWAEYDTTDIHNFQHFYLVVEPEYGGLSEKLYDTDGANGLTTPMVVWDHQSIRACAAIGEASCTGWR